MAHGRGRDVPLTRFPITIVNFTIRGRLNIKRASGVTLPIFLYQTEG